MYRTERVKLTPELATKWIETIVHNRSVNDTIVRTYVSELKAGNWVSDNGTTMSFDTNGELRDGQHRCWAVLNSGISMWVLVNYDVKPEAIKTIDQNYRRTVADTITMETKEINKSGVPYAITIAHALNFVHAWIHHKNIYYKRRILNKEGWDMYQKHPGINYSAERICSTKLAIAPKTVCVAMHYIFSMVESHKPLVDIFFDKLINGDGLSAKSPILVIRNKFITAKSDPRNYPHSSFFINGLIKAWEAWVEGRDVTNFTYKSDNLPQPSKRLRVARTPEGHKIVRVQHSLTSV
jgi:hypothetical protein